MGAFEGAIKADELTLVVIKTLHLVECHLLDRRGWFHEHERVGEVAQRSGEVPPRSKRLLLEPFLGGKRQRWRESAHLGDGLSLRFDLISILTGSFQTRLLYCVASPASPQRLISF